MKDHKADNEKRLRALAKHQENLKKQKKAISDALSQSLNGNCSKNKKIKFSSDTEDEDKTDDTKSLQNDNKQLNLNLFDDDDDGKDDCHTEAEHFNFKPQYVGIEGKKLLDLQTTYGNDERFVMDERFADDDEEHDDMNVETNDEANEKARNLKIIDKVVGPLKNSQKRKSNQLDQPTTKMIRYNPSKIEHKVYEMASDSVNKPKDTTTKASLEVSKEKYFDVSKSLIADLKGDEAEKSSFSLLKTLKGEVEESPVYFNSNHIFINNDDKLDTSFEKKRNSQTAEKSDIPLRTKRVVDSAYPLFFTSNDERLDQGSAFFCRTEPLEVLREVYVEKRSQIKKEVDGHRKHDLRRKNPVQRLGNKNKFRFVNARKKRFQ